MATTMTTPATSGQTTRDHMEGPPGPKPGVITALFHESLAKFADNVALRVKENKAYRDITYRELGEQVEKMASGLHALGVAKGDRVALLSENRPEWAVADLGALMLGAAVAPLYPTLPTPQVAYIIRNAGAKVAVVENAKQLKKVMDARADLPDLERIIVMESGDAVGNGVQSLASLLEQGAREPMGAEAYQAKWRSVEPDDLASLVYTSGTTGDPKGTMLTHGNFTFNVDSALGHFGANGGPVSETDVFLSFLPLSHTYERTTGFYLPLRVGASIAYSDGVRTLADDMAKAQPTIMVCVPRVYDSFHQRVLDTVAKAPEKRQKMFERALAVGKAYQDKTRWGGGAGPILGLQHLFFEKMVFAKTRERFGGKLRFFVSGSAALNAETYDFFSTIGIPISEGYGMTESAPAITANPVFRSKVGTVGIAFPGVEVKIEPTGEICARGPNIMRGYWKNDEATRDMIDADGWLHTGDVGAIDADGYLKITDRIKDIIVLANGKKVAPQPIEGALKQSQFINEIVLIGDKQSVVTALVLPNKEKLRQGVKEAGGVAADVLADDDALLQTAQARKIIKAEIDAHSKHLADFEKIKRFALLSATFSVDGGEMTPTLKIKRKVVLQKYAREVAAMSGLGAGGDAAAE